MCASQTMDQVNAQSLARAEQGGHVVPGEVSLRWKFAVSVVKDVQLNIHCAALNLIHQTKIRTKTYTQWIVQAIVASTTLRRTFLTVACANSSRYWIR